jgi:hypothetical protein
MNYVKIISLKKNEIKYVVKVKKKINYYRFIICGMIFVIVFMLTSINYKGVINNPVNSLYSDNSGVVFTDGYVMNEKLNFSIPIVTSNIDVLSDGTINFLVGNSIIVKAVESGVVDFVGESSDGIKYIKIMHNIDCYSIISNVDLFGVKKGDLVTKGKNIATSKMGSTVSLRMYENEMQISNISVVGSKIICLN